MVERTKSEMVEEFDGVCDNIEIVPDQLNEGQEQFHLEIKPDDDEILKGSKTGKFHEWLRITKTATAESVPDGSKMDRYLQEIEAVFPEAKGAKKVEDALRMFEGKHVHFVRKKLGKAYKGYDSKPSFVPQKLLKK